jgi:hypothetical protein
LKARWKCERFGSLRGEGGGEPVIDLGSLFSSSKPADGTKQQCAHAGRKVVRVRWNVADFVWCSDEVPIAGVTENYGDGEQIPVALSDRRDASRSYGQLQTTVRGNAFESKWKIVNVLPDRDGDGGYRPRLEVDGRAGNARTPFGLPVRFLNNQDKCDYRFMNVDYRREDPALKEEERTFSIYTNFWIGLENYLLTIYGDLEYVRGWGKCTSVR